jgi:hypothetical protein
MIYLNVSYDQKDHAKSLGAKWDAQKKKWYAPDETFTDLIETYGGGGGGGGSTSSTQQKSGGVRINKIPYSGGSFSSYGSGGSGSGSSAAKSKVSIHKANHPSSRTPQQECCFDDDD